MTHPGAETLAVLDQLCVLVAMARSYGAEHPSVEAAARVLVDGVRAAEPPFGVQFLVGAVFRDRTLVPMDVDRYERIMDLGARLHRGGAQEIAFDGLPRVEDLMTLGGALASASRSEVPNLDSLGLATIGFREIPDARPGAELETVDEEVFVAAQLVLALRATRSAIEWHHRSADGSWPFALGMEVVRRLERAVETHAAVAASTLEVAPGALDVARRALLAAHHTATVCAALRAPKHIARATVHVSLVVASLGLTEREGLDFREAALAARGAAVTALASGASDPHRMLVAALLHDLAGRGALEVGPLVQLAYRMERHRRPAGVSFDLALVDLLTFVVTEMGDGLGPHAKWARLRVLVAGIMPAGARVRLADGRRGVVLGPGASGDPELPCVLVEGCRVDVTTPPTLEGTPIEPPAKRAPPPFAEPQALAARRDPRRESTSAPRPALVGGAIEARPTRRKAER